MSSWLSGSSNLSSRLTKALRNSRLWPNRNGSGQGPFIQPDVTIYLLLAILVLLIFLCVAVMAFFYVSQTGRADEGTAVPPTTTLDETTEVIVIIATPTITSTLPAPTAVPTPVLPPMTCSDLQRHDPLVTDGEYTLFLNRNPAFPVNIYCHNMTAVPAEYITLNNTGDNTNFASTAYPDDELITRYAKVRVDLHTLVLDPTDRTFATVTGSVPFYSNVPYNDYGRAVGCNEARPGVALGRGNIDLSGTNFTLDETVAFTLQGTDVEGSGAQIAPDGLIVTLEAGGRCGWVAPDGPLHLNYVPSATQTGAP